MKSAKPIMILAGGTGGHIFPALAVAQELLERGKEIIWVGAPDSMESTLVPNMGIPFTTISIRGLRRSGWKRYVKFPFMLVRAMVEAIATIKQCKPCVVLGMGGFVAGPCGMASVLLRVPLIVHEQNSIPGLTNRILSPLSRYFFTGFLLPSKRASIHCGNPVRKPLLQIAEPSQRAIGQRKKIRILILGGSQGAKALNAVVPEALAKMDSTTRPDIWHQTGRGNSESTLALYEKLRVDARVNDFIQDMEQAYCWADFVICRSGAMTLAEISAVGLGSILVPYPYAVDDHQTANAMQFVDIGAAVLMPESNLSAHVLSECLIQFNGERKRLLEMAMAARKLTVSNASARIADACVELCGVND